MFSITWRLWAYELRYLIPVMATDHHGLVKKCLFSLRPLYLHLFLLYSWWIDPQQRYLAKFQLFRIFRVLILFRFSQSLPYFIFNEQFEFVWKGILFCGSDFVSKGFDRFLAHSIRLLCPEQGLILSHECFIDVFLGVIAVCVVSLVGSSSVISLRKPI